MSDAHTTPKADYQREGNQLKTLATLLPYLWPPGQPKLRLLVVGALAFLLVAITATSITPLILGAAVDALNDSANAIPEGSAALIAIPIGLILAYGGARIATMLFGEVRDGLFAPVKQAAIRIVGLKTFRHLHALSLRFHLDRQTGGLSRAIERGGKGIEFVLSFMLFNILPTLLQILIASVILWVRYGWEFAAATFVTIVGYIVFTIWATEWRLKYRRQMNEADTDSATKAVDSLLNYETVKYFGNEEHEASRYDVALRRFQRAAVNSQISLSFLNTGQAMIIAGGVTLVMLMAAYAIRAGTMSIGDFVVVNAFILQLYLPLNFLGFVYREIKQSLIDMEYMFNILEVDQEIADPVGAPRLHADDAELVFENVDFAYNADRQILKGVNFTVPAGKTVAIVGPSGSGKSTIGRLMFRFYDIQAGSIKIDGQDIRSVQQQSLRAEIGIVPQDTVLFNDTIRYNIGYGRPSATDAEIEEAAKLASIHDFILGLPDGYETRVGERGLKLSGGERQRVAIARTILKRPRILLFDEATSALDSQTEEAIQQALDEVSQGRTTLMIAHRLSTVVGADEIIVLAGGQVVERGTHHDLLAQHGQYAEMWHRQQDDPDAAAQEAMGRKKIRDDLPI